MNLANLLDCMGEFGAAEILHKETVAGLSATVGNTHTSTLMVRVAIIRAGLIDRGPIGLLRIG